MARGRGVARLSPCSNCENHYGLSQLSVRAPISLSNYPRLAAWTWVRYPSFEDAGA
jgi:hypothetical protein